MPILLVSFGLALQILELLQCLGIVGRLSKHFPDSLQSQAGGFTESLGHGERRREGKRGEKEETQ